MTSPNRQPHTAPALTLDESEIETLNSSFTQSGVKWLAMFSGLWAEVASVKNGMLVLQIIYPETSPGQDKREQVIRLLINCRAFTFMDQLESIYVIEYTDAGTAGGIQRTGGEANSPFNNPGSYNAQFGDTKHMIRDTVYSMDELALFVNS